MLTEHAVTESVFMTTMTKEIQKDSKFIKLLTFIAILYSPASLMAVGPTFLFHQTLNMINKS